MLEVFYLSLPAPAQAKRLVPSLPLWRQEKARRIQNEAAFCASVGAGVLWQQAMVRCGIDPESPVELLPAGKPVLQSGALFFSLSHSGPWALCAVSDRPVGADVQEPRPARLSLARRFCPAERQWLESLPPEEQNRALLALWARKEAWVKADSRDRILALDEYDVHSPQPPWVFSDFRLPGDCPASVCAPEAAGRLQCIEIQNLLNT